MAPAEAEEGEAAATLSKLPASADARAPPPPPPPPPPSCPPPSSGGGLGGSGGGGGCVSRYSMACSSGSRRPRA
jgi:hypothetical protein